MKKAKLVLFGGVLFIVGAVGGIFSANVFKTNEPVAAECGHSLEEKMMYWMVNDAWPEPQVKRAEIEIPVSMFPKDYEYDDYHFKAKDKKAFATEVDLDDDNQPEYIVYSGSGNRNVTYDIFKIYDGQLQHCGSTGGIDFVVIKHNGRTGIFSKWGGGYARATYSFSQLVKGKMETVISFYVDGSEKSIPGKNDKMTIQLETSNNFMKKQYRWSIPQTSKDN